LEKKTNWSLKLNFVSPIIRPVEETQGGFRVRLQVASAFFPQIIGKGGQIKVQSLILAIIPWILRVRLQVASAFFPQIIGKGGQTKVQPLILAIIPWILSVRLQVASAFFPQIIGKGGQIKVQLY
jgi:predicted RNA-binding protein YlqC (UPF0109 family)